MPTSMGNCATVRERSIWPLMLTPTAVVSRQRNRWPAGSENKASTCAGFRCPRATIRTASSSRLATHASSSHCWRLPYHDVSCSSPALPQPSTLPVSRHRADDRTRDWLDQSVSRLRETPSLGGCDPEKLCVGVAALSPLVGKCPPHRHDRPSCPQRINAAGLCAIPVQSTTPLEREHHQPAGCDCGARPANRLPGRSRTNCSWVSAHLLAARTDGHRKTPAGLEPVASKDPQTNHRAAVGRRGDTVLVQFPHLA